MFLCPTVRQPGEIGPDREDVDEWQVHPFLGLPRVYRDPLIRYFICRNVFSMRSFVPERMKVVYIRMKIGEDDIDDCISFFFPPIAYLRELEER